MGADAPIPPTMMAAADSKNLRFFSNQSSLMRRLIPLRGAPAAA